MLLKKRVPLGSGLRIPIEVKSKIAAPKGVEQLNGYMDELRGESPIGILIASDFNKKVIARAAEAHH